MASGKSGTVKVGLVDVCEVIKWKFDPQCAVAKYASNKTGGYKKAVPGVFDCKGTVEIKLDSVAGMDFLVGSSPTLLLHIDATGNNFYEVPAVIAGAPIDVDIDNGEPVSCTYAFEGNGAWVANGALA